MKKIVLLAAAFLCLMNTTTVFADTDENIMDITRAAGYQVEEKNKPKSSIVIDAEYGQILWEENADLPHDPASIAKLMTIFLTFDAMKEDGFDLDTLITATPTDQKISEIYAISNSKIVAGVEYPVRELLKMVTVPSSNVATVMLANYVSKNDAGRFIQMMNKKAADLEMENTRFNNCSGASASAFEGLYLPQGFDSNAGNTTTARDLAIMCYHLVNDHPEVLEFTNKPTVTVMAGTPYEESFDTYNYSVEGAEYGVKGVDGLKTGSGPNSAFNYIATGKRGDLRLVEVILGVGDWSDQNGEYYRHPFGNAILEKCFNEYEHKKILSAGTKEFDGQKINVKKDLYGVVKKDTEPAFELVGDEIAFSDQLPQAASDMPQMSVEYKKNKTAKPAEKEEKFSLKKLFSFFK